MNASATLLPAVVRPVVEERHWLSSDHCADSVLGLLTTLGWAVVDTPEANVHATSPDGRVYVGWLPENTTAWKRGIVWQVRVQPTEGDPWVQEFGLHTPSEAVAGFISALVAHH
ncbi:SPDY domain-containing protein [Streptomyces sp. S6]